MKKLILLSALIFTSTTALADTYVKGYSRKDGTYVQPHHRSAPDNNPFNNYSSQGNQNPYTGQQGYQQPRQPSPYNQQPRSARSPFEQDDNDNNFGSYR